MLDDTTKELVRNLSNPHRVANIMALFKFCERAATIIQDQAGELAKLKAQPEKTAPKKSAKK
jgi:hypothetical protein|tara:strand:+ start:132 stop:317 length:186 start_codon:yes stop_codon:yes gene_type:complete